jgi:TIR domain/HEAT repeats/NACHT domain
MEPDASVGKRDFFVSYAGEDRDWALWIAHVLEQAEYSVLMQHWDFLPGSDWVHGMHRAAMESSATVAVLSHSYLRSMHGEAEWRMAYRADPSGELGLLIPVRIDDVTPPGLLATRVYIDLYQLDEAEARRQLLQGVRRPPAPDRTRPPTQLSTAACPRSLAAGPPVPPPAPETAADPMLSDYLDAVATQYEELPYIALRTGVRLSSVYVPQYVEDISQYVEEVSVGAPKGSEPSLALAAGRTGDSIIDSDTHVLIEGGPGTGKSSLVGHVATQVARGSHYLPAVVRAHALHAAVGSFSQRLVEAVTAELGGRLIRPLSGDFFAVEREGKRWLVLVDGLDEIVSARDRAKLITDLLHISAIVDSPYRIVIATRPVQTESQHDWSGFSRLRLLPLTDEQIAVFAESWFRQSTGPAEPGAAQHFVSELKYRGLTELVRSPLVLTMAASVFAPDARHTLPGNRTGIYERFLDLVDDEESERQTRAAFREAWDQRYGHRGEAIADEIFSSRRQILEYLAEESQEGIADDLRDRAVTYITQRWAAPGDMKLDPEWLSHQVAVLFTRSALVIPAAGTYQFIHETVREYLVAHATVHSGLLPGDPGSRALVQRWRLQPWRQVILFLLGIWSNHGENIDELLALIRDGQPDGTVFAASAMAEGVELSPAARDETIRALGALVRSMSWGQVLFADPNPFRVMVSLGGVLCAEELLATALDRDAEAPVRAMSAEVLSEFSLDGRTLDVLTGLAQDPREVMVRHGAATALARLGRLEVALPVLEEVISDPDAGLLLRSRAVDTLGRHEATQSLLRVARLATLDPSLREAAAVHLEARGYGAQAARTLSALVEDDQVDARVRERAVLDLYRGDETGALRELVDSESVDGWIRVLAATYLARGDLDGSIQRLRAIVRDERQDERVRLRAVHALGALNDDTGMLSLAQTQEGLVGLAAAAGAPRRGHLDLLLSLARRAAADPQLEPDVRYEATEVLHRLGGAGEAAQLFLSLARSAGVPSHVKEDAVLSLANGRHSAELLTICEDTTLPTWLRVSACDAISQVGSRDVRRWPFFAELRASADGWLRRRLDALEEGTLA